MKHRLEESVVSRVEWADPDRCGQSGGVGTRRPWVEDGVLQRVDHLATVTPQPIKLATRQPA